MKNLIDINSNKLKQTLVKCLTLVLLGSGLSGCKNPSEYITYADRNEIITIGDSIFDKSGELQVFLEQHASQTFRRYTQGGSYLANNAGSTPIVQQYADAKADDATIETVVMNGGGNDIMVPAAVFDNYKCRTPWHRPNLSVQCKSYIDDLYIDTVDLLNTMAADGVSNVLYLGYYHPKGLFSNLAQAVDYGNLRIQDACANSVVNCTFVESRSIITPNDIISDGLHPTTIGSQKLADLIWPSLQALL